jgi:hypothetical protein
VGAVMPLVERKGARFKLLEKIIVAHKIPGLPEHWQVEKRMVASGKGNWHFSWWHRLMKTNRRISIKVFCGRPSQQWTSETELSRRRKGDKVKADMGQTTAKGSGDDLGVRHWQSAANAMQTPSNNEPS